MNDIRWSLVNNNPFQKKSLDLNVAELIGVKLPKTSAIFLVETFPNFLVSSFSFNCLQVDQQRHKASTFSEASLSNFEAVFFSLSISPFTQIGFHQSITDFQLQTPFRKSLQSSFFKCNSPTISIDLKFNSINNSDRFPHPINSFLFHENWPALNRTSKS